MNWDTYLFHASSLGSIMTDSRTKDPLGETCKGHLMECWIKERYGREKKFSNKYTEKGIEQEEDSISLYALQKKAAFFKNSRTFSNDWIIGTPDIITKDTIIDIKTSWSIHTFYAVLSKPVDKGYELQLQAYMELTERDHAKLVYCLVNTPEKLINDAKRKLAWDMMVIDPETDERYLEACAQLEREMIFDDIPPRERYIELSVERDPKVMAKVQARILECRHFLKKLDSAYEPEMVVS